MSGMGGTLQLLNPTVVAAFRAALIHQGIIALLIFFAGHALGERAGMGARDAAGPPARGRRPAGRRAARAPGAADRLRRPVAAGRHPADAVGHAARPAHQRDRAVRGVIPRLGPAHRGLGCAGLVVSPGQRAASAVWIQLGIGIWLLTATHGRWLRLGGLVSAGWGLVVWVFGESFGGIFAPGLTWLFGAPGAALFYTVAGLLIALPPQAWRTARLGRLVLAAMGLFFTGMAILQAWPGRGYWQGKTGNLVGMIQGMAQTSQPPFLAALVRGFGSFTAAHGFIVNLVAVIALAAIGLAFLSGQRRVVRPALVLLVVLCAADWVLIEDMGIFGGLGTDPNSMIPLVLVVIGGYLALVSVPAEAIATAPAAAPGTAGPATPRARHHGARHPRARR